MRRKRHISGSFSGYQFLRRVSVGIITSVVILTALFVYNRNILPNEVLLYETMPFYNYDADGTISKLFSLSTDNRRAETVTETPDSRRSEAVSEPPDDSTPVTYYDTEAYTDDETVNVFIADESKQDSAYQIEKDIPNYSEYDIVSTDTVVYQPPEAENSGLTSHEPESIAPFHEEWLSDVSFLRKNFYSVAPITEMTAEDFDGKKFVDMDLTITPSGNDPKVLIFHTHMYEGFADSDPNNLLDGVYGLGEKLAQILLDKYGIVAMHHNGRYDMIDGKVSISGAYERMEPDIIKLLEQNPSIEVVIDMHRDGVGENVKLISTIDGESVAPIMFVNGLSKILQNGVLKPIASLPNPYQAENLAMSFQMQLAANELYPGFARRIYLNAYRFSLNMAPKSLLIEVGAQTNTKAEAFRAIEPLADILAKVILKSPNS